MEKIGSGGGGFPKELGVGVSFHQTPFSQLEVH